MRALTIVLLFALLAGGCATGATDDPSAGNESSSESPSMPVTGAVQGPGEVLPDSGAFYNKNDGSSSPRYVTGTNPVLGTDRADPHVIRVVENGRPTYYMTYTSGHSDIPIYTSTDLVNWKSTGKTAFGKTVPAGGPVAVNGSRLCHIWAPQIVQVGSGFLLNFTALRFGTSRTSCPGYGEDSGVYLASSATVTGPFATSDHSWEPLPAGTNEASCGNLRNSLPHSFPYAARLCQGTYCHQVIRLDSDVWRDEKTGRWWMSYAWYTNTPPYVEWERSNYGEHVNLVELDAKDPYAVKCDKDTPQIQIGNPHDKVTQEKLGRACTGCDQMLSFTRNIAGNEEVRDGCSWGVVEGSSLFRRGEYVYALMSGSIYNSPYYHVFWVAAKTVEGLDYTKGERLAGRFLIPSDGQNFGHGMPILGPNGRNWYYIFHRMNSDACKNRNDCSRDLWVAPIEFENKGDGLGDVYIRARWPAKNTSFQVAL